MNKKVVITTRGIFFLITLTIVISLLIIFVSINNSDIAYADEKINNVDTSTIYETKVVEIYEEVEKHIEKDVCIMQKIGDFKLTAYCSCTKCCEKWGGSPEGKIGAWGIGAYDGITFAVDPTVIPYGTKIYIEGVGVGIASDCGGAIKNARIDVYFDNHEEALQFGTGDGVTHSVYIIEDVVEN